MRLRFLSQGLSLTGKILSDLNQKMSILNQIHCKGEICKGEMRKIRTGNDSVN